MLPGLCHGGMSRVGQRRSQPDFLVFGIQGGLADEALGKQLLLTPELADTISRSERLILIDAAAEGVPGEVRCFPIAADSAAAASLAIGTHEVTLDRLLGMAQELFGRCPPAHMVTISGESFEVSESLTATVEAAVPEALRQVINLVRAG